MHELLKVYFSLRPMDVFLNSKNGRLVRSVNITSYSESHVYGSVLIFIVSFAFIIVLTHSAFLKASIGQSTILNSFLFYCFEIEWLIFRHIATSVLWF